MAEHSNDAWVRQFSDDSNDVWVRAADVHVEHIYIYIHIYIHVGPVPTQPFSINTNGSRWHGNMRSTGSILPSATHLLRVELLCFVLPLLLFPANGDSSIHVHSVEGLVVGGGGQGHPLPGAFSIRYSLTLFLSLTKRCLPLLLSATLI